MYKSAMAFLIFCAVLGPGLGSAQEKPVLAQEYEPEADRPGFWWTRREGEYTLQFYGAAAPQAVLRAVMPDTEQAMSQAGSPRGPDDLVRGSSFIRDTLANLRALDPMSGCRPTLTLIDGRRKANPGNEVPAPPQSAPQPQAQTQPPLLQQPAFQPLGDVEMQVWLLNRDGSVVMPQRKSPADVKYCDKGIVYGFDLQAARDAVAVAFTIGDQYFVQKLRPFADESQ
jgi:hypothetical protein